MKFHSSSQSQPKKHQHPAIMHLLRTPVLALMVVALILVNSFSGPAQVSASSDRLNQQSLLSQHNQQRQKYGLPPLKLSEGLNTSAQRKAKAMLEADCWSHYCPNGKSPWDFFGEAGYEYLLAGENLAEGFYNTSDVIDAWMNSPTHRDNILRQDYEEVGFGIVRGQFQGSASNVVIAVHFGTPSRSPLLGFNSSGQGDIPTPEILRPANNTYLSGNLVEVYGTAPQATEVELFLNNSPANKVPVDQGIFTYNKELIDGEYTISAMSRIGARESVRSDQTLFSVDNEPNVITLEDLTLVGRNNDVIRVNITSPGLDKVSFTFDNETVEFTNVEDSIWSGNVTIDQLNQFDSIDISTVDRAGNIWEGTIETVSLVEDAAQLRPLDELPDSDGTSGRVISADLKTQFNLGALVLFSGLFGFDFLLLKRTGLTKSNGRTQLHIGLLLIVLVIMLTSSMSGQILNGLVV